MLVDAGPPFCPSDAVWEASDYVLAGCQRRGRLSGRGTYGADKKRKDYERKRRDYEQGACVCNSGNRNQPQW